MANIQVYSWRVASDTKAELERAARQANRSLAGLLDGIVREWLDAIQAEGIDQAEQKRLPTAAAGSIGVLGGGNPYRTAQAR
jgi:hypothetical protein